MKVAILLQKATTDPRLAEVAVAAHAEMFERGIGPPGDISWHYKDHALVAYRGEDIAGFLNFRHEDDDVLVIVTQGYVKPSYRRMGVYRQLWDALVKIARARGAKRIWGGTSVENQEMRAFWLKVGRLEQFVTGEYTIPKEKRKRHGKEKE